MNVSCKFFSLLLLMASTTACSSFTSSKIQHSATQDSLPHSAVTIDKPIIHSLNGAPEKLRPLQKSLVRLRVKDASGESLSTGFFYRTKELLVTSLHTFSEKQECLHKPICTLQIGFVKNESSLNELQVQVSRALVVPHKDLIFLNIVNPIENQDIRPLQDSTVQLHMQEQLSVGGFFEDNPALTFTLGKPLPHKQKNLTSVIVSAGFSGSPIVNSQGQLVGVVSGFMPIKNQKIGLAQYVSLTNED